MQMREASKEDLPDIYCDLDQVLVAFIKGAEKAIGGDFATSDKDERWKAINQTKGFWANLDWMPGAKRLYDFIIRYESRILSAYSNRDGNSKIGKMKWLKKKKTQNKQIGCLAVNTRHRLHLTIRCYTKYFSFRYQFFDQKQPKLWIF